MVRLEFVAFFKPTTMEECGFIAQSYFTKTSLSKLIP